MKASYHHLLGLVLLSVVVATLNRDGELFFVLWLVVSHE